VESGETNATTWGRGGSSAPLSRVLVLLLTLVSLALAGGGIGGLSARVGGTVAVGLVDGEAVQIRAVAPAGLSVARPRVQNPAASGADAPIDPELSASPPRFPRPARRDGTFASASDGGPHLAASGLFSRRVTMGPPDPGRPEIPKTQSFRPRSAENAA